MMGWARIFGDSPKKNQDKKEGFDQQQLVKDAPQQEEAMRARFGKQLIQMIKDYQKMLRSKSLNSSMRAQLEETYAFMVRVARKDVYHLISFQSEAIKIYWCLDDDEAKEALDAIISRMDQLIGRQAQLLRKINCAIQIQTSECRKQESFLDFYQSIEQLIAKGEYKEALILLFSYHYIFDLEHKESLLVVAQNAVLSYPKDAEDFLLLLTKRLSLRSISPNLQDYSEFISNQLIHAPEMSLLQNNQAACLAVLQEGAVTIHRCLWEARLKEHYNNWILKELDSLVGLVQQKRPWALINSPVNRGI